MSEAQVVSLARRGPQRCRAITVRGVPCRNQAVEEAQFCRVHLPSDARESPNLLSGPLDILRRDDLAGLVEFLRRRMRGEYEVDTFGFDRELSEMVLPVLGPLIEKYWRVEVIGNDHLPAEGAALLTANHAGALPVDGVVLRSLVWQRPPHRHLRMLVADLAFTMPFLSGLVRKTGNTMACAEDAERLLDAGEIVAVFPEGFKGVGKGFRQRYRLQRFGRGGFVEVAIRTGTPIIPVSIVGSEEIYPMIADVRPLARLLGLPYFPITPLFPWLGPLGMLPLPSKWIVEFGEPIATEHLGPDAASDPMVVFETTDQVRQAIQQTLVKNLRIRRSAFW
ncbi:MAG TPA: lysophospholipid acyltransferase family protein [Actinomycetota bacterium]|nr:lysophospholipid acyltransferase family protein [Actinomycetota bacterium]